MRSRREPGQTSVRRGEEPRAPGVFFERRRHRVAYPIPASDPREPRPPPVAQRAPLLGGVHRPPARLAQGARAPLARHRRPRRGAPPPGRDAVPLSRGPRLRAVAEDGSAAAAARAARVRGRRLSARYPMSSTAFETAPARAARDAATWTFTSESVTEGHPDKVCDFIADSILDAYLQLDPRSRVACEVLAKCGVVVVAGEITSVDSLDHLKLVREAIRRVGYVDPAERFHADGVHVVQHVTGQAWEIGRGVDPSTSRCGEQGAGDQGIMFGFATDE